MKKILKKGDTISLNGDLAEVVDKSKKKADDDPSEQTPIYAIGFDMYENGISRALKLDYGDFVVDGTMSSLEVKSAKPCR